MDTQDLVALAEREAQLLEQSNALASAAVMRAMIERVKHLCARLREGGMTERTGLHAVDTKR